MHPKVSAKENGEKRTAGERGRQAPIMHTHMNHHDLTAQGQGQGLSHEAVLKGWARGIGLVED